MGEFIEKIKETNPTSDHLRYFRVNDPEDDRKIMKRLLPYIKEAVAAYHDARGVIETLKEFYLHTAGTGEEE